MKNFLRSCTGALAALAVLFTLSAPARAQQMCLPYSQLVEGLKTGPFKEVLVFDGVDSRRGENVRLFVGPKGTYTLVVVGSNGMACVVSLGDGVKTRPAPKRGQPV